MVEVRRRRSLRTLRRQLRRGMHPKKMPHEVIGSGAFRTAYLVDDYWVVKEEQPRDYGDQQWRGDLREVSKTLRRHFGDLLRPAPTYRVKVNGRDEWWEVQRRYWPLDELDVRAVERMFDVERYYGRSRVCWLDLHSQNIGVDDDGRFVAFDW